LTDRHVRILALAARQSRRRLAAHDAADDTSPEHRPALEQKAARTEMRLSVARARRRFDRSETPAP